MRPNSRLMSLAGLAVGVAIVVGACSASTATPGSAVQGASATPAGPAATAMAESFTVGSTNDATLGAYLTGRDGLTLYVLTKDAADTSTCTGNCPMTWPPLTVAPGTTITGPDGATGTFATIMRADGTTQVTYNHMPLYYFSADNKAGDTAGQGKAGVWFVAPLSGSVPAAAPATTAPATAVPAATPKPTKAPPLPSYGY
jgi:predicted lipoprotein with Yx(FWY)xxD motif